MLMTRFSDLSVCRHTGTRSLAINLALSGSGSHGAFGWGILDKLLEDGRFVAEGVAASGTDAINAAVLAFGLMRGRRDGARELLESLWLEISRGGALGEHLAAEHTRRTFHQGWNSAADFLTAFVDFGELRRGRDINLLLQAANARTGRPRFFTNCQITVEALLACSRLPQSAPPIRLGDDVYWDGRYCGLAAMEQLMMLATSPDLLVGHVSATGGRMVDQGAMEVEICTAERALSQLLEREVLAPPRSCDKPERDWNSPASERDEFEVRVHQIRSTDVMADLMPSSRLDIRWATIARFRDMGRLAAEIWLQSIPYGIGEASINGHHASLGARPC